jgi:hypothetical protein
MLFYNLSYSQSIIVLPLIYPLHKPLGHAIRFLATDLSQELSLRITMKSSCHFLFNHHGMPTFQNSTQFSSANSLISVVRSNWLPCIDAARTYGKYVSHVRTLGVDHIDNTASSVAKACLPRCCLAIKSFVAAGMLLPSRCLAMGIHVTILYGL